MDPGPPTDTAMTAEEPKRLPIEVWGMAFKRIRTDILWRTCRQVCRAWRDEVDFHARRELTSVRPNCIIVRKPHVVDDTPGIVAKYTSIGLSEDRKLVKFRIQVLRGREIPQDSQGFHAQLLYSFSWELMIQLEHKIRNPIAEDELRNIAAANALPYSDGNYTEYCEISIDWMQFLDTLVFENAMVSHGEVITRIMPVEIPVPPVREATDSGNCSERRYNVPYLIERETLNAPHFTREASYLIRNLIFRLKSLMRVCKKILTSSRIG
jgi:hypothetical protein